MIQFLLSVKRMWSSISMFDLSIYKITLATFGAAVVSYFPIVISGVWWIYLLITIVLRSMMMRSIFAHPSSSKGFFQQIGDRMRKMSFFGRVVFELYVISMAILIIKLFPMIIVSIHPLWFVISAAIGTGYLLGIIAKK